MTNDDGFEILDSASTEHIFPKPRGPRGPYKKKSIQIIDFESDGYRVLDESETELEFTLLTPEQYDAVPVKVGDSTWNSRDESRKATHRPVCFVDGEGANVGDAIISIRKNTDGLTRAVQAQNYALLGAVIEKDGEYRCKVGQNNSEALSTRDCLEFIIRLPADHVTVGFYLVYDIEKILKDLDKDKMAELVKYKKAWWKKYLLHYIPGKLLSVSKWRGKRKLGSKTIYDISGFFQTTFVEALDNWEIGDPETKAWIAKMKDARKNFGPITEEVKTYNKQEGIYGIELFKRVRDEYTKLGLQISRPVGAGSIASAMFRKHRLDHFQPTFQSLPTEVMLQSFIGGRFDIARIGPVGDTFQHDINSAYPYIASNLPCLAHARFEWTQNYIPDPYSLWLVRWIDNDNKWSPFPYRTSAGHVRYYSSGMGYYYGREVTMALKLDADIEIIGGYYLIRECDHRPFHWIEDYYSIRQEMLRNGDFGEKVIKLGLNSVYGKLAQTKGQTPKYQNLIWAGMITSGTRAMLLEAISQDPSNVINCATDAVVCFRPLSLHLDKTILGAWKTKQLQNLLLLGNGIYHSTNGIEGHRGFADFNWEQHRDNYLQYGYTIAIKREFMKFSGASQNKRLEERGSWIEEEIRLTFDPPKGKELRNDWIWPGVNETPQIISHPARIETSSLRIHGT